MGESPEILDLSNKKIKKLNKCSPQEAQASTLILDDNELQRLDNIDSFVRLQKLSAVHNQLLRMYGVCRLHSLHTLNLAHNGILTIEGLKDLVNLRWLCLAGNSIKTIEHLNTNVNLEHLDLSENNITHINDLSFLKNLKELFLHSNKINHLRQCERFLPISLTTLTLANNNIEDLNEISQLVHLVNLVNISITNNPCVNMCNQSIGFDYRPFVINWCLNVKTIDGYVVDPIESLRAEWLYSQGRGRHFRVGDQKDLAQYLASVCPLTGETLETEEDRKLRLILSKAQHHQQQLLEQSVESPNPSPLSRKKLHGPKHSPRLNSNRLGGHNKMKSPDRMSSSFYSSNSGSALTGGGSNVLDNSMSCMTQSLDPSILRQSISSTTVTTPMSNKIGDPQHCHHNPAMTGSVNENSKCLDYSDSPLVNSPLQALSKMVPVPESLMSPDYRPPITIATATAGVNNTGANNSQHHPVTSSPLLISNSNSNSGSKIRGQQQHITRSPKMMHRSGGGGGGGSGGTAGTVLPTSKNKIGCHGNVTGEGRKSNSPSPARLRKTAVSDNHTPQQQQQQQQQQQCCNVSNKSILRKSPPSSDYDDESSEIFTSKLHMIQQRAEEKQKFFNQQLQQQQQQQQQHKGGGVETVTHATNCHGNANANVSNNAEDKVEQAAVYIQKMWRGYFARNKNKEVQEVFRTLQAQRAGQYIQQLTNDMETTKAALESERKIQMLQTEAISALWKQMSNLQPGVGNNQASTAGGVGNGGGSNVENSEIVKELTRTCSVLQNQIQQLQSSMQDIVKVMTVFSQTTKLNSSAVHLPENVMATQTEIVAVHTPQGEAAKIFPFQKHQQLTMMRPSSLPLPVSQRKKDGNNCAGNNNNSGTSNLHQICGNAGGGPSNADGATAEHLQQYAGDLVDDVMRTVSNETDATQEHQMKITVTASPATDNNST